MGSRPGWRHAVSYFLLITFCFSLSLIAGCGESADHRLDRARIALQSNKADAALELADSVVQERPEDQEALLVKAEAEMRLLHLDASQQTLEKLLTANPQLAEARRKMVNWSFHRMHNLLNQSGYESNPKLQEQFQQAMDTGSAQAEWIRQHDNGDVEADYHQARLAYLHMRSLEKLFEAQKRSLASMSYDDNGNPIYGPEVELLRTQAEQRRKDYLDRLQAVLAKDPRHFDAASIYLAQLTQIQDHAQTWVLAQKIAKEKDLPPELVANLVVALIVLPDSIQPQAARISVAQDMLEAVDGKRREAPPYKLSLARLALVRNEPDKALPLLEAVLKQQSRDSDARYLKAQALFLKSDFQGARDILKQLVTEVRNPSVFRLYGQVLAQTGDNPQALDYLKQAIDMNPKDSLAQRLFIEVQAKSGNLGLSNVVEDHYLKNPADANAIRFKIQREKVNNRPGTVKEVLEKVELLKPLSDEHVAILVDGYQYLRDLHRAERFARELARRQPDKLESQLILAQTLLLQGEEDQVKTILADLHRKFPDSTNVEQMMAQLYLQRGSYDKAVELLEGVLKRQPGDDRARLLLVRALASLALYEDALGQLTQYLESNPKDPDAHLLAYRIYGNMGRDEEANQHMAQVEMANVDERSNPVLMVQIKIRENDLDGAADVANRALAMGNTDAMLRQLLAGIYLKKGEPKQAEDNLLAMVRAQPGNAFGFAALGRFYVEQKMLTKGLTEMANLQTVNETLSRLTQSSLLLSASRPDDAMAAIVPIYQPMVQARDPRTLAVADAIARINLVRKDVPAAVAVYDPLIKADLSATQARLRQIDLTTSRDGNDATARKLDELAAKLTPDDRQIRLALVQRYANLGKSQRALGIVDEWEALTPSDVGVVRVKAQLLRQLGSNDKALDYIKKSLKTWPDDVPLRKHLAQNYLDLRDFPQVEATILELAQQGAGVRITALSDLGQFFVALGLNHQAGEAFDRLEREGRVHDPRVLLAMGRAMAALGRHEQALVRLEAVPNYSPQYPPTQVLMASLEQMTGKIDAARQRLEKLAANPNYAQVASQELLKLDLRNQRSEDLLRWSQAKLATGALSEQDRRAWMAIRVGIADSRGEAPALLDELTRIDKAYPDSMQIVASQALVYLLQDKPEQARQIYLNTPKLASTWYGPMLAAMLGEKAQTPADYPALDTYIVAMAMGDVDRARAAVDRLTPIRTIYAGDLRAIVERSDATSPSMRRAFAQLAGARLGLQTTLPQTAATFAKAAAKVIPTLVPAYGLWVEAQVQMVQPTDEIHRALLKSAPGASLTLYVDAGIKGSNGDFAGAAAALATLVEREPANESARYYYSQMLTAAGQKDKAIEQLRILYAKLPAAQSGGGAGAGSLQVPVSNDLAYLMAEQDPQQAQAAWEIAQKAYELSNRQPALLDTLGWIAHLRGDDKQAMVYLTQAISPLRDLPEVHYHMGVVYQSLGNKAWARYHLEEAAAGKSKTTADAAKKALAVLK
ncbi:MAG: tetratricopeptide repeat protein [Phycisphaeraceae bacterium]